MKIVHVVISATLLGLISSGCGTMKIPQYTGEPSVTAQVRQVQGLKLTFDPFLDAERADTYFKVNPRRRGMVIGQLRADNTDTNAAWLLREELMVLRDPQQGIHMTAHGQNVQANLAAGNAVGMAGAAVISLPMIFASAKLTSDALVVAKNFVDNEWHNQTLSPGHKSDGFIYFLLPDKATLSKEACVEIQCVDVRSNTTNSVVFALNHETQ